MAAKNLTRVKSRTILTVLAIALGTALLTGITILNESYLNSYLNGVSKQLGYTDIGVKKHLNVSDGYFDENDFIKESNVEDIEGYLEHTSRIVSEHVAIDAPEQPEEFAYETTFFGIDVEKDVNYGYAEILEWTKEVGKNLGKDPENIEDILKLNRKYCVITTWVKEVYGFELGEELYIPIKNDPNNDLDNSSTWGIYEVAAIINDFAEGWDISYDYSKNESSRRHISRAIYVDIREARDMLNITGDKVNLFYIHVELSKLNDFGLKLLKEMSNDYYGENIKAGEMDRVRDSVESMQMILIIFTMISFIIAAMLTLNTLMMSVTEQKYEVGVLRAQGIYKSEVFKLFLFEGLILALIGSILGIFMGMGMSPLLKKLFFTTIMADSDFQLVLSYNWVSLLIIFGITFSVSLIISLLPAFIATKIQIIEAIRNLKSDKKTSNIRKLIFPFTGILLSGLGYYILTTSYRDIIATMIGIIPFILGLIILSTIFIPFLSKGFSYLFSFFLGSYRKVTDRNLKREPKQTKITFIMFGLAIGFLVMVSNVLNSLDKVYYEAIPRYLGGDIIINSEGSTFGMDEVLLQDEDVIAGCIDKAALINGMRIKIDDYGTWAHEKEDEPRVTLYIIEGEKFYDTVNEITMLDTNDLKDEEVWKKLDTELNSIIVCKQLVDANHLNKELGDEVKIDFGADFIVDTEIIGIADFVAGISETWEDRSDVMPADSRGEYCVFTSWQTVIPIINDYFDWLPDSDLVLKGNDGDFDYWDYPWINRSLTKQEIIKFANDNGYGGKFQLAERVWDNETNAVVADPDANNFTQLIYGVNAKNIHTAWENISLEGYTNFSSSINGYETVQEALVGGNHCVITKDIEDELGFNAGDKISYWYQNTTGALVRKNFTIAGVISFETSIEAINFHAKNPYVEGDYDVAADDSSAIIFNINQTAAKGPGLMYEDYFNRTNQVYEFWIKLTDYFDDHLLFIAGLQEYLGNDYVIADMRWLFTREFSYAPGWIIQVDEDWIEENNGNTQEEALERIKEFLLLNNMPVINWYTVDGVREQYADQIEFQKSFFNIVLSFALIISVLGIMINMLISIANRKREIGMMRAIGTYKSSLIKMILGETMILVFSGFLIGAVMGTISSNQMILGLPLDSVFNLRLIIDYWSILTLFGIVILISVVAAALPAYRVLKLDIIEAMRVI
ncbi:MAG: FtsX-like permease family protein [Promethearchaeota archaeon]